MLLKRLEAYGFKSFADRIEVEFNKGITAIVGPNGSGKSNITDAIRWVLGEQNIRSLRGNKAEDIIFAGSSTRKQFGIAEVSLTFDNTDGQLPIEYQEVTITRRLFRSGESECYINKTHCRLKDIYELFADTGLGKNSMSVISQNKVDEVLNAKPEDRRLLFEECAGITKYRDRKKEAEKKLENTKQNILRINDIIAEIEKQLLPLSQEAEKTSRYNELKNKYDKYNLSYILCDYEKLSAEQKKYTDQINQLEQKSTNQNIALTTIDNLIAATEESIAVSEKDLSDRDENNRKIIEEINRIRSNCTVLEERIKQNSHTINNLKTAHTSTLAQKKTAEENLASLQQTILNTEKEKNTLADNLSSTKTAIKTNEKKIIVQETLLQQLNAETEQHRRTEEIKQRQILLLQHDIIEKERLLKEKENNRLIRQREYDKITADIAKIAAELQTIVSDNKLLQTETINLQEKKATLKRKLYEIENTCNSLSLETNRAKERITILTNMQKSYEGFGNGVKKVLTASQYFWHQNICGSVAEIINVPKQYLTAIEVALGSSLQNIITADTDTAKQAIEFLKEKNLGRVTFLPLTAVKPKSINQPFDSTWHGFINYADKLVSSDAKYQAIIEALLGRTIVIDTIDNALHLAKKANYSLRIVTLSGEILYPGGAVSGGSLKHNLNFLNRENEIKQISAKNQQTIGRLLAAKTQQGQLLSDISELEAAISSNESTCQRYSISYTEKNARHIHLTEENNKRKNDISADFNAVTAINTELSALKAAQIKYTRQIQLTKSTNTSNVTQHSDIEKSITHYKTEQKSLQQQLLQQSSAFAGITQNITGINEKITLIQTEYERCESFLSNNQNQQARAQTSINDSISELKDLQSSSQNLQQLYTNGRRDYDTAHSSLMDKRIKSKNYAADRKKLTENISKLQEDLHQINIKATKISFDIAQHEKNLQEQYNLSPQAALNYKEDLNEDNLLENIKRIRAELTAIGSVNPNAVIEYDTLNKRCQFLKTQIQDLLTAKDNLQQIIEQINLSMTKQFKEAFSGIENHFNEIFKHLFGGGRARLILTDQENILSSGVEIIVQAPGKKNQNMTLLSGGERTLTVIALLFAFLQYRPAPFSVLDEIDAPLDEANIKRFSIFLKDYAQKTQFIIVTHRKGTMEAADVMYGITMADAGISKIISVKMTEAEE